MKFPSAYALAAVGLLGGYSIAWYIHEGARPEAYGIALIVGILFAIGSSWPIKYWLCWLQEHDAAQMYAANQNEMQRKKAEREQLAWEREQIKLQKLMNPKKSNSGFDSEDFDETSKAIILGLVRDARRAGVKVTGQGLIGGVLKQIH